MIKHIVFWKITQLSGKDTRTEVFQQFNQKTEYLKTVIPEIIAARVALNDSASEYDICIDSVFASMEALEAYIIHPEHLKVREYMDSVTCGKTVFDYFYEGEPA